MSKKSTAKGGGSPKLKSATFDTEQIIDALVILKEKRKYPALPGEIISALPVPKSRVEALKKYLQTLGKEEVLVPSKKGRYRAYMLAGEDPRYSRKLDNALKFELLAEIDQLKGRILEIQARAGTPESADLGDTRFQAANLEGLEEEVLRRIAALSRSRNRRTVDLWEVRRTLRDIPPQTLDAVLESLGSSWRIELQLVQDGTKLSPDEKAALLRLSDGKLVAAVAVASD